MDVKYALSLKSYMHISHKILLFQALQSMAIILSGRIRSFSIFCSIFCLQMHNPNANIIVSFFVIAFYKQSIMSDKS